MKYNWFLNILNLLSWILNWRQYALRLYLTFKPDFSLCNNLDRQLRSLSLDIVSIRYFFLGFRSRCFVQTRFRLIVQLLISFVRRHSFSAALHFTLSVGLLPCRVIICHALRGMAFPVCVGGPVHVVGWGVPGLFGVSGCLNFSC